MAILNQMKLSFDSLSENVGIARVAAAAFAAQIDLTLDELEEVKVAVSEAVSNSVIHGYGDTHGQIDLSMLLTDNTLEFMICDAGKGIEDIEKAKQPSYSSDPERLGLGFVFMQTFMDELDVRSELGKGTTVRLVKKYEITKAH